MFKFFMLLIGDAGYCRFQYLKLLAKTNSNSSATGFRVHFPLKETRHHLSLQVACLQSTQTP